VAIHAPYKIHLTDYEHKSASKKSEKGPKREIAEMILPGAPIQKREKKKKEIHRFSKHKLKGKTKPGSKPGATHQRWSLVPERIGAPKVRKNKFFSPARPSGPEKKKKEKKKKKKKRKKKKKKPKTARPKIKS